MKTPPPDRPGGTLADRLPAAKLEALQQLRAELAAREGIDDEAWDRAAAAFEEKMAGQ